MCWNKFNAADDEEDIEVGHAGEAELDEIPTGNIHQIQLFQEITAGGVAVGGMAAHGLVNGMSGASPTGMSEANLPRPHLRRTSQTAGDTSIRNRGDAYKSSAGRRHACFHNILSYR